MTTIFNLEPVAQPWHMIPTNALAYMDPVELLGLLEEMHFVRCSMSASESRLRDRFGACTAGNLFQDIEVFFSSYYVAAKNSLIGLKIDDRNTAMERVRFLLQEGLDLVAEPNDLRIIADDMHDLAKLIKELPTELPPVAERVSPASTELAGSAMERMIAEYIAVKAQYIGDLLFWDMGETFELYFGDAVIAAAAIGLRVDKGAPYCGRAVPTFFGPIGCLKSHTDRLLEKGHGVAITRLAKGRREVVRTIRPEMRVENETVR